MGRRRNVSSSYGRTVGDAVSRFERVCDGRSRITLVISSNRLSAQKEAVHEFAHVVSLNLHPNFGNNPRWLWESVAMFAAEEFRDPKDVPSLREGSYPTLEELNTDFNSGRSIYDVGYVLVDYIINTWDHDHLIALIRSNGAIEQTLGISESDFEKGWQQYVEETYLSSSH